MSDRYRTALLAFEQTLERLDLPEDALDSDEAQEHLGRRAALMAAAEAAWESQLGPLYAWQDVAELLGSVGTRQGVHDLARRRRVLGLPTKRGQLLYPAFQFKGGKAVEGLHEVLDVFADVPLSPWSIASWLTTPQDELAGDTPVGPGRRGRRAPAGDPTHGGEGCRLARRRPPTWQSRAPTRPPSPAFPAYQLAVGAESHRIHSAAFGAWYFNPDEAWRFNLCLLADKGTCYLAERAVAGLLESFKGMRSVDEADVQAKAHFAVVLDRPLRLADCCAPGAGAYGVNAEIHTTTDYGKTQRWASALAQAGFEGVRYFCRSDLSLGLVGYALFGDAGAQPAGRWPEGTDRPISDDNLIEAEAYGLHVLPTP